MCARPTPQGQSLAEIADAVFRSAIVLATYGEALALVMPFLRKRAVVVHVAEQPGHDDMHAYVRQWVEGLAPQAGTSLVEVTNTYVDNIVIDLERLATRDWCARFWFSSLLVGGVRPRAAVGLEGRRRGEASCSIVSPQPA